MADVRGPTRISYRRKLLQETSALSAALHNRGVPAWRDVDGWFDEPAEASIRPVLNDNNTSGAVLWPTRRAVRATIFSGAPLSDRQMQDLVNLTDADGRGCGYTYSDRVDRQLPAACLAAYSDRPLTGDRARRNQPTPPFAQRGDLR